MPRSPVRRPGNEVTTGVPSPEERLAHSARISIKPIAGASPRPRQLGPRRGDLRVEDLAASSRVCRSRAIAASQAAPAPTCPPYRRPAPLAAARARATRPPVSSAAAAASAHTCHDAPGPTLRMPRSVRVGPPRPHARADRLLQVGTHLVERPLERLLPPSQPFPRRSDAANSSYRSAGPAVDKPLQVRPRENADRRLGGSGVTWKAFRFGAMPATSGLPAVTATFTSAAARPSRRHVFAKVRRTFGRQRPPPTTRFQRHRARQRSWSYRCRSTRKSPP